MVPVTVPRTVGKHRGILQFWIDDSINLQHMLEQKLQPTGWCPANPQYNLMNVFDLLINNTDRTQQNALFTREWMLVLIDHSRAFSTDTKQPVLLYKNPVELPPSAGEAARNARPGIARDGGRSLSAQEADRRRAEAPRSLTEPVRHAGRREEACRSLSRRRLRRSDGHIRVR